MAGENEAEAEAEPKRGALDENHVDQLNGPYQILMFQAAPVSHLISRSHLPVKLITRLRQNF